MIYLAVGLAAGFALGFGVAIAGARYITQRHIRIYHPHEVERFVYHKAKNGARQ